LTLEESSRQQAVLQRVGRSRFENARSRKRHHQLSDNRVVGARDENALLECPGGRRRVALE